MDYDLCVIGGGINGTGIARDAAGRGLSVLLVEAQDLAGATSSASTKLVHGGLRYLEQFEFKLVKESLEEREILLNSAPHIIWPMEFILPHDKHLRPQWMIKIGLKLYDLLGGRKKLAKSKSIDFATHPIGDPLQDKYETGFSYADCWCEDARLVVLNAVDAYERGAVIMPRTACVNLEPSFDKDAWDVTLEDMASGDNFQIKARQVVNVAGPWVRSLLDNNELVDNDVVTLDVPSVRLIKGSHIVVPAIYEGKQSYLLQQQDGRVVFAIPYEGKWTLIGTTDVAFEGDPSQVTIDQVEIDYLCHAVNQSFKKQISHKDVFYTYSGVRSLVDDGAKNSSKVTRDYKLFLDKRFGPPILSVFGGKLTTHRHLAEEVMDRLSTLYPNKKLKSWTAKAKLPGGDFDGKSFEEFYKEIRVAYKFLPDNLLLRYARAYGSRTKYLIGESQSKNDLGEYFGDNIYEAEILYLIRYEFATTLEDVLWRRSKLGLHISSTTKDHLEKSFPDLLYMVAGEENNYAHFARH